MLDGMRLSFIGAKLHKAAPRNLCIGGGCFAGASIFEEGAGAS